MRLILSAAAALLAAATFTAPSQAQNAAFMWCQATADNGAEATTYYSAFFAAGVWEEEVKARAFKSEVADQEVSASTVTAQCTGSANYDDAVATRNAAMKAAPGTVLSWEG